MVNAFLSAVCALSWTAATCACGCWLWDNASTDGSVEAVPSLTPGADPRVTVLRNPKNLYFARGNNVGIRLTLEQSPDYVFILNNDTELPRIA